MSEENKNIDPEENLSGEAAENNLNADESTQEPLDTQAEENAETGETVIDETQTPEDMQEDTSAQEVEQIVTMAIEEKSNKKGIIIGVVVLVVVIAAAVLCKMYGSKWFNKYNRMGYINTRGRNIGEVADMAGMSLEEFLEEYSLPDDMPANTDESAAYYMIPTKVVAEKFYYSDFETLKTEMELGDDITEDTPWGETEGNIKVISYVAGGDEEMFQQFKEYYGFGDEVTADTLWKEVRNTVDLKNKEEAEAAAKAEEEAANSTEPPIEETETAAPSTDVQSADGAAADATAAADGTAAEVTAAPAQ